MAEALLTFGALLLLLGLCAAVEQRSRQWSDDERVSLFPSEPMSDEWLHAQRVDESKQSDFEGVTWNAQALQQDREQA